VRRMNTLVLFLILEQTISVFSPFSMMLKVGYQWLMPVILASWEAEIRRIMVQGQLRQIVCKTESLKLPDWNGLEVWLKQ
jgi:hypothetical protein